MALVEGGAGIGWLRDLQPAALRELASITGIAVADLYDQRPRTSFAQNADGSIFFTATGIERPFRVRWAYIQRDGKRHPPTGYEEESAIREACRIAPWDVYQLLESSGAPEVDVKEVMT